MKSRVIIAIAAAVLLVSLAVSLWAWGRIPDGEQIPIHWGLDGRANGWAPKPVGLLLVPGIIAIMGIAFGAIPYLDPRRDHQARSTTARLWIMGAALLVLGVVHVAATPTAVGASVDIGRVVVIAVGGLFVVMATTSGRCAATGSWGFAPRGPSRASSPGRGRTGWAATSSSPLER